MVPVDVTPTEKKVPDGFFENLEEKHGPMTAFCIVNPNKCWVRLRGTSKLILGSVPTASIPVSDSTGWLFPPGVMAVFSTQKPTFMSAMAVEKQGIIPQAPFYDVEVSYGIGT